MRLDRWVKAHAPELTHARLQKLLRTGQIRIGGGRAKANQRVQAGDLVRLPPEVTSAGGMVESDDGPQPARAKTSPKTSDDALVRDLLGRVLYRDDEILVIDKPSGLAVQGGSGLGRHLDGALDGLRFGTAERPRLVHRLDRDTSGVIALARTRKAAADLTRGFREKGIRKLYWAAVAGVPDHPAGTIGMALEKKSNAFGREKMAEGDADDEGQRAVSHYWVIETLGRRAAWLAMSPETGRTHQLRVHAARGLDCPILGDGKYGGRSAFPGGLNVSKRLHLHARRLVIPRPGAPMIDVSAPLPDHMQEAWNRFGFTITTDADQFP